MNAIAGIQELNNWKEVTRGLYRFVIGASVAYEIHILYHAEETDILTAKASLYLVREWKEAGARCFVLERELLLGEQPVFECLRVAKKDYEKNFKPSRCLKILDMLLPII